MAGSGQDLSLLTKDELLQLRHRILDALGGISTARKDAAGAVNEGSMYSRLAGICAAAFAVKGVCDIIMSVTEKMTGPAGKGIAAGYKVATGTIEGVYAVSDGDGLGTAAATGKSYGVLAGAATLRAIGGKTVSDAAKLTTATIGNTAMIGSSMENTQSTERVRRVKVTGGLISQAGIGLGYFARNNLSQVGDVVSGAADILDGFQKMQVNTEQWKGLNQFGEGTLLQMDNTIAHLKQRQIEVEQAIARYNAKARFLP